MYPFSIRLVAVHHWALFVFVHLSYVTGLVISPSNPRVGAASEARSNVTHTDVTSPYPAKVLGGYPKVGLAWSNGEDNHLPQYVTSKTHFIYTWGATCPNQARSLGLNCARMLWGPAGSRVSSFRQYRTSPGTNILMGMNEVNNAQQANMGVGAGVALWNAEIRPWGKRGYTLVAPSVTTAPSGIRWLQGFFAQCGGNDKCGVDIVPIHYYGTSVQDFKNYVSKFHQTFGLPIWVTEFACTNFAGGPQCSKAQVWNFMSSVTAWMNAQYYVDAYFAFGLLHYMWGVNPMNQLMKPDGTPTDLGYYYIYS